jgi:sulfur transfer protein SufE
MNENLRKLMLEAGYAAPELAGRAQQLAELIVRECMSELYIHGYDDARTQIKQYFGVEQ